MARDLARRIGALENGNGTIGIGELLDAVDDKSIDCSDPRTWPAAWAGKTINAALLRSLDGLEPGFTRYDTAQMELIVAGDETRFLPLEDSA